MTTWRDSMPPGLPVFVGTPVEDLARSARPGVVVRASEDGALVLADDGAQWSAYVSDVRINLDERAGIGAAVCALGPVECDADGWPNTHAWLFAFAAEDIDDELRLAIADACADAVSAQVERAEADERRRAEDKARRVANMADFNVIGDALFSAGVDYDWTKSSPAEADDGPSEVKLATDDIACAGCIEARERAKEEPARCDACGQEWA